MNNIMQLYKILVQPHLEYAVQIYRPYKQKHLNLIESRLIRPSRSINDFYWKSEQEQAAIYGL